WGPRSGCYSGWNRASAMEQSILVVEGDELLPSNIQSNLERKGNEEQVQQSAAAALASMAVFNADVVLTDSSLPGMNGLELIRVLQEQLPQTKIIMMTGYGNIEDAVAAMKAGAFHYLTKLVVLSELLLLLDKCRQAQGMERQLSFYQQR